MASEDDKKPGDPKRYPLLEWASAALGLLITAVMFGLLAYEAVLQQAEIPPAIEVKPTALYRVGGQYLVEIDVRNEARETASTVQVEGTLKTGATTVETSTTTIDYIPGESHREAALVFMRDPRGTPLRLRVSGYSRP